MNNFNTSRLNRRKFLKRTSAAALGMGMMPLTGWSVTPPSDKVRVAHIGVGNMGNNHLNWFAELPEVDIVALCDVDEERVKGTLENLKKKKPESKAKIYGDFREILDRQDIDAITCATPDHWHAQIAMLAFQAGKDVYGEKPLSYNVTEGQQMLQSLQKNNRVFQLGTQIHATDNFHRVVELVQSGKLGKIHTVHLWRHQESPGLGFPPNEPVPDHLDWDMWLGPAPYAPYNPARCHKTYRYFLDYSGGVYADFWSHIADIAFWSLNPQGLESIEAHGDIPYNGIAEAPQWINVDFRFKELDMKWTSTPPDFPGADEQGIGAVFEGEKGWLMCDYNSKVIHINGEVMDDIPDVPKSIERSPGHQQNFIDAVKSRNQPESNLEYVRKMTLPMHLGLISFQLKRKLYWNSKTETFKGDHAANALLSRENRQPWDLI